MLYCESDLVETRVIPMTHPLNEEENGQEEDSPYRSRRFSYGSGWGMFENDIDRSVEVRSVWLNMIGTPTYSYGKSVYKKDHETIKVLFHWKNPSPSVSFKHLSNDGNLPDVPSESMELSCYLDGFHIVQYSNGEIKAEYCLCFSYGSISYLSYKSYTQFAKYFETIRLIHLNIKPLFTKTLQEWETLQNRKKWYRCLAIPYLKEKCILIGRVVQLSLMESPTPGLLLDFLNSKTKT